MEYSNKKTGFASSNRDERAIDTQWPSFSAQRAGVGTLEVFEHAVSIGNEIGGHLDGYQTAQLKVE